jgi:hypothetical protein
LHEYLNNKQVDSLIKNFGSSVEGYSLGRTANKHTITKKSEVVRRGYIYNSSRQECEIIATISLVMMNNCVALSDLIDRPKKDVMKDAMEELREKVKLYHE